MALDVDARRQDLPSRWRLRTLVSPGPRSEAAAPPVPSSRCSKPSHFLPIASLLNPHTGLKRRRHHLDVDGPNTAALSSKKRRLRLNLVTSPLSRPYAQPASHIHVRTDTKTISNKAAALSAQSKLPHLPATSFLRLSVVNRMRERMHLRGPPTASPDARFNAVDTGPRASWFHSHGPRHPRHSKLPLPMAPPRPPVVDKPDRPRPAPDKTLPQLQTEPAPPRADLKLAAIDTITSLLSDTPPPPSEDRLFAAVDPDFGQADFALSPHHQDGPSQLQDVYCDFGILFGKTRPRCAGTRDQRPRGAPGLNEVPLVAR